MLRHQDIHVFERRNEYKPNNEISMGSAKWLTMHRYHQTGSCIDSIKTRGYKLVATTPNVEGYDLLTLPPDQPIALMFGTEEKGFSEKVLDAADATLRLPM